jgi:hypothetical protein
LWKSILLEIWMNCRWVRQPPSHPLLGLMMNYCFGTRFHSSFTENLTMSSRRFVLHLFFLDILSLRYHDTDQIWISVRYDGWNIIPGVIILVLWWPGKVMSCLAHLTGGLIIIVSFFCKVNHSSRRNCKTYLIWCSWWIICVSNVRPLLETSYHCYLEAWLWYLDHQQEHWKHKC